MSDKPISGLRARIIADMTIRAFSDKTQRETISGMLRHLPDFSAARRQGAPPSKMNGQASALRFFFSITVGRADLAHQLARTHIRASCRGSSLQKRSAG